MPRLSAKKEYPFFDLYEKFIQDSKRGKRLQPNGKKFSPGTIRNYEATLRLLKKFSEEKEYPLSIRSLRTLNQRALEREQNYWKKFYKHFSAYLYEGLGNYDNYVGLQFKNIKIFFNYLNKEYAFHTSTVQKLFYVRKEEIAIFPLMPEELNYLIYDKTFEEGLNKRMKEVKDFFVIGCTVALRVSDLIALQKANLRIINGGYYLSVRSIKTGTDTLIKLPDYAIELLNRYKKQRRFLLPRFNKSNLNQYIKELLEMAGFTQVVHVRRERRGKAIELKDNLHTANKQYRFCDVASTHTMRRTAITTMLCLGVPEQVVRKISGHAPGSKEFYRYVLWAQTYQDKETEQMFERLKEKRLKVA